MLRNAIGLVAGFGAGLLAGYFMFGVCASPLSPRAAPTSKERTSASCPQPDVGSSFEPRSADVRAQVFRSGTAESILRAIERPPPSPLTVAEESALLARIEEAVALRNGPLLDALVHVLSMNPSEQVQERLLHLMLDEAIPDLRGGDFFRALKESDLPGIASAARRRVEMNIGRGETSWMAGYGWFDLVLAHGDDRQIDWALSRNESDEIHSQALESLVRCSAPRAIERTSTLLRAGALNATFLGYFAECNPRPAFEIINERISMSGAFDAEDPNTVAAIYGRCAPEARVADVRRLLLGLASRASRISAIYAAQALARRGFDVGELGPLFREPVDILERGDSSDAQQDLLSMARYAIKFNPVCWSARAADALQRAGFGDDASKVRRELASPWRR